MRLRNIPGAEEYCRNHPRCFFPEDIEEPAWKEKCGKLTPLHIEIGMGKGRFLMDLSRLNPQIQYIGIEKYPSVLYRALQKYEEDPLPNLRFLCLNAENITDAFQARQVDRIYLNFSDPWPKDRHAKRRLTSPQFLDRYAVILNPSGHIEFKTDNQDLFTYSLEQVAPCGWHLDQCTRDLHHDPVMNQGNIMTEYEEKFSSMGNPICKMIISR